MARWSREITTLGAARREFARNKSPWMLGTAIVAVAVARVLGGDPSWRDGVAIAAMLALYPSASGRFTCSSCIGSPPRDSAAG